MVILGSMTPQITITGSSVEIGDMASPHWWRGHKLQPIFAVYGVGQMGAGVLWGWWQRHSSKYWHSHQLRTDEIPLVESPVMEISSITWKFHPLVGDFINLETFKTISWKFHPSVGNFIHWCGSSCWFNEAPNHRVQNLKVGRQVGVHPRKENQAGNLIH
jgi:hypothetical protein